MNPMQQPPSPTLLPGVLVGHDTDQRRPTGVTVVVLPEGTTTGVDVRGAAPGTRETDLLQPVNTMQGADAVMLSGGSAFGLDAAGGVMRWLEAQGRGVQVGAARVPIVPAAVIFDLWLGDPTVRPDAESGARACAGAVPLAEAREGSVGAGAGASVGKLLGPLLAMRGGLGIASVHAHGLTVSAVVAVNAVGDVVDPEQGPLAGARAAIASLELAGSVRSLLGHPAPPGPTGDPSGESSPADDPGPAGQLRLGRQHDDWRDRHGRGAEQDPGHPDGASGSRWPCSDDPPRPHHHGRRHLVRRGYRDRGPSGSGRRCRPMRSGSCFR